MAMTTKKKGKSAKKKWDFSIGVKPMSQKDADAAVDKFMSAMNERFKDAPEAEVRKGAQKIKDFIGGRISWAELFSFTPEMLFQMAEFGFAQFKAGRYQDAERIFKVLTVLDWNNSYYHSVMGSILQREKRFGEAIAEYSQAIDLDPKDIVSFTNRGEIFLQHGLIDEAEADLAKAIELDIDGDDKFANRARMLMQQLAAKKEELKGEAEE
jgi:tetratricopeptide (TPR) repeat protein